VNQPPPPLGLGDPVFSPRFDTIVLRCLEKEPEKRYASASQLAVDLRRLKEDSENKGITAAAQGAPEVAVTGAKHRQSWKAVAGWLVGLAAVAALAMGVWPLVRGSAAQPAAPGRKATAPARQKSVAVLPFVNLSPDKADEYLSDGMTVELWSVLARIKELRVPGQTSSFAFKNRTEDIRSIGKQLNVATVLEGSVRKAGNQLRITAQLIDVAADCRLWSDTYDRDLTNIFAIHSDIAARVAEALKVELLGATRPPTEDIVAYNLYLHGRDLWNRRTAESIKQAIELFKEAIEKDPSFALAYAGSADCYILLAEYTAMPPQKTFPLALEAARRALELDGTLPGPKAVLANYLCTFEWEWKEAETDYRKLIASDPNYATARQWLAQLLEMQGRYADALAECQRAQDIDPASQIIKANVGLQLFLAAHEEKAIESLTKQIKLDSSFSAAHLHLGLIHLIRGRASQAIVELEKAQQLDPVGPLPLGFLGVAYSQAGSTPDATKVLEELQQMQEQDHDCRVAIALVQQALGDDPSAMDSLARAFEEHASGLVWLRSDPVFKGLRSHPRGQEILKKMFPPK
jgi:TolB-like protein/Flp pilus assembly protein TadD